MAESDQFACPVMGRTACFQAHDAARQIRKKIQDVLPPDCFGYDNLARCVDRMYLEDVFCEVKANGRNGAEISRNLAHGWNSFVNVRERPYWHAFFPDGGETGAVHPIKRA
ncbi:MAG: hypothetical protein WDN46_23475 [Methylocella sp.]